MRQLEFLVDGRNYRVMLDGKAITVRDPHDLKALTLDIRDKDQRFYEQLMKSEQFRMIAAGAAQADSMLDALNNLIAAWRRRRGN